LPVGSYVVAVVPVVMPSVKISSTLPQNAGSVTSVNGPYNPSREPAPPAKIAAATAQKRRSTDRDRLKVQPAEG